MCYAAADLVKNCPITGVKFFKIGSTELTNFEYYEATGGAWTKTPGYPGYSMYYTTGAVDALPLTQTKFAYKPCMHPAQVETDPANKFYILEV